jgi:hypothetical protein
VPTGALGAGVNGGVNLQQRCLVRARGGDGDLAKTGEGLTRVGPTIGLDDWKDGVKVVTGGDPPPPRCARKRLM